MSAGLNVDLVSAVVTLFLIMDPIGNIAPFLSVLKSVAPERRRRVLVREICFAYLALLACLFLGDVVLHFLRLEESTISVAGGIVLFLIALRMIFPGDGGSDDAPEGEPFIVPLAVPLFAGPSALAFLLLLQRSAPGRTASLLLAVTIAWAARSVATWRRASWSGERLFQAPWTTSTGKSRHALRRPRGLRPTGSQPLMATTPANRSGYVRASQ